MRGWRRKMSFEDTGLPWVMPSPNMPTVDTAFVYPGGCLIEGTNLSEGRGTTRPFELVGAPWIDAWALARDLAKEKIPGVAFRATWFTPTFQKHAGVAVRRRAAPRDGPRGSFRRSWPTRSSFTTPGDKRPPASPGATRRTSTSK